MPRKETVTKIVDGDTIETSVRKNQLELMALIPPKKVNPVILRQKRLSKNF